MRRVGIPDRRVLGGSGKLLPPGTPGAPAAPVVTPLTIFGANLIQWCRADLGVTVSTGVSAWADQTANANNYAQPTGGSQPLLTATDATLNNLPTIMFDGVDDALLNTTANLGTLPLAVLMVMKQVVWTSGKVLSCADSAASTLGIIAGGVTPQLRQINSTQTNTNGGDPVASWARLIAEFTNSAADRLKLIATAVTGGNAGALVGTGYRLGRQGGVATAFSNYAIHEICLIQGTPSAQNYIDYDAYVTARCGPGLV